MTPLDLERHRASTWPKIMQIAFWTVIGLGWAWLIPDVLGMWR